MPERGTSPRSLTFQAAGFKKALTTAPYGPRQGHRSKIGELFMEIDQGML